MTVSTVMVGALVTWRPKNALAAFASWKIEVLRVSSIAADADDVGETMVISTRVDAAKARVVTALGSTPDAAATEVEMVASLAGVKSDISS